MAELWLGHYRAVVGIRRYPTWQRAGFGFHENGGRQFPECFDISLVIGKVVVSFTLWRIGRWARILQCLPKNRTECYLIRPIGAKESE